jgi:hypothetical protein
MGMDAVIKKYADNHAEALREDLGILMLLDGAPVEGAWHSLDNVRTHERILRKQTQIYDFNFYMHSGLHGEETRIQATPIAREVLERVSGGKRGRD